MSTTKNTTMGRVKVMAGRNGAVVTATKNPDHGYIMLEQMVASQNRNTKFLGEKRRTALLFGTVEMLLALKWKVGQEVTGRIVLTESLEKNKGMSPKVAGSTGVTCKKEGKVIYHMTHFSFDPSEPDVTLRHDNNSEIAAAAKVPRDFDVSQI
jgi:hypothetical protein